MIFNLSDSGFISYILYDFKHIVDWSKLLFDVSGCTMYALLLVAAVGFICTNITIKLNAVIFLRSVLYFLWIYKTGKKNNNFHFFPLDKGTGCSHKPCKLWTVWIFKGDENSYYRFVLQNNAYDNIYMLCGSCLNPVHCSIGKRINR